MYRGYFFGGSNPGILRAFPDNDIGHPGLIRAYFNVGSGNDSGTGIQVFHHADGLEEILYFIRLHFIASSRQEVA